MKSPICDLLGIEFPLIAFTHCRDVVVEVSKAGGMGVLGAAPMRLDEFKTSLDWIDDHIDGKPYGVDLIVPNAYVGKDDGATKAKRPEIDSSAQRQFVRDVLIAHDIDVSDITDERMQRKPRLAKNADAAGATDILDVAFSHPIKLIANALGVPPTYMLQRSKAEGVPVAALVGTKEHAIAQAKAGVDILVAAGGEAGGHCGEISTLVLIPEVYRAVKPYGDIPILAAGGIVTGSQMAACMAMGAAGAWTGSVWLTTSEAETLSVAKEKMLAAKSSDTIRSRCRTGKPSRQLKSAWTDAWEAEDAPKALPMPLQISVSEIAMDKVAKLAESGHEGAKKLTSYWVGQGVGMMNEITSSRQVMYDFMEDFIEASERLGGVTSE